MHFNSNRLRHNRNDRVNDPINFIKFENLNKSIKQSLDKLPPKK